MTPTPTDPREEKPPEGYRIMTNEEMMKPVKKGELVFFRGEWIKSQRDGMAHSAAFNYATPIEQAESTNSKLAAEIAEKDQEINALRVTLAEEIAKRVNTPNLAFLNAEVARLQSEIKDWRAGAKVEADEADSLRAQLATLRAELEAQKQWRNEAEGKLIECGREIANHVTELEAANAREEFLKSKGLTVGMLTESGKEPHLAYVIEPESELCDLRYIHENLDLKRELEAARKETDRVYREFVSKDALDTALAAKDAAEKRLCESQEEIRKALIYLSEWMHARHPHPSSIEHANDRLIAALTPASTQEPPAGGVTPEGSGA